MSASLLTGGKYPIRGIEQAKGENLFFGGGTGPELAAGGNLRCLSLDGMRFDLGFDGRDCGRDRRFDDNEVLADRGRRDFATL